MKKIILQIVEKMCIHENMNNSSVSPFRETYRLFVPVKEVKIQFAPNLFCNS